MKKLTLTFLALSPLVLASCNMFKAPEAKNLDGTVVEGTLTTDAAGKKTLTTSAWTGGVGQVILKVPVKGGASEEVTRTPLAADGKFNFAELPVLADKYLGSPAPQHDSSCTSNVTISDETARSVMAALIVDSTKSGAVFAHTSDDATNGAVLTYADKATTLKGQVKCTSSARSASTTYNMDLKAGWNLLQITTLGNDTTLSTVSPIKGQNWVYTPNNTTPGLLSLQGLSQR